MSGTTFGHILQQVYLEMLCGDLPGYTSCKGYIPTNVGHILSQSKFFRTYPVAAVSRSAIYCPFDFTYIPVYDYSSSTKVVFNSIELTIP